MLSKFLTFGSVTAAPVVSIPWVNRYTNRGASQQNAVAVDASGNIYTAGQIYATVNNAALTKHNPDGRIIWQRLYGTNSSAQSQYGMGVAVDSAGNVIMTTQGQTPGGHVTKWSSAGVLLWHRAIYGDLTNGYATGVSTDSSNNVYVSAYLYKATPDSSNSHHLFKWDANGAIQWKRRLKVGTNLSRADGVATDSAGNSYVSGTVYPTVSQGDNTLSKYDASGALQWSRKIVAATTTTVNYFYGVALDGQGNVYTAGSYILSGATRGLICKWTTSGTLVWKKYLYQNGVSTILTAIAVSKANPNDIYVTAQMNTSTNMDGAVIKLTSAGAYVWDKIIYGTNSLADRANGVTTNSNGDVFVAGYNTTATGVSDAYLVKTLSTAPVSATYGNFSLGWWAGVFTIEDCAATEAAGTGTDTASTFTDSTTPAATAYISEDLYVIS